MRDLVGKRQICKADMEKAQLWQEFDERIMFPIQKNVKKYWKQESRK